MPNLRVFDIIHEDFRSKTDLPYHDLIDKFKSPFWIEKNGFFTHQHSWRKSFDGGVFYSTEPY
ncbi:unnamed protein product, partial [Rotaria sordida]